MIRDIEKCIVDTNQCKNEYPTDQKMSKNDFVQLLTEKANMLKKHLKDTQSS